MVTAVTNTEPRRRNRRGEGGKLRDEIIAAALALLDEGGDERAVTLRSVAIAEHLAGLFRERDEYFVEVAHRDVDRLPIRR